MTEGLKFSEVEIGDDLPEEVPDVSLSSVTAFCRKKAFQER